MRYSEARGTLIYEKNIKSKISCQTPFKPFLFTSANMQVKILLLMLISSLVAVGVLVSNLSFTICVIDATYPFLSAHRNEFWFIDLG